MPGVVGATAPPARHRGPDSLVEAFPAIDGAAPGIQATIDRVDAALRGTDGTLTGVAAVDRDLLHALFGSLPYVLALIMLVTLILLARAFRSIVLAIKAALLNVVSLGAAFGIVVFVFQQGHGSSLWNIDATQSVTAWIPVMDATASPAAEPRPGSRARGGLRRAVGSSAGLDGVRDQPGIEHGHPD